MAYNKQHRIPTLLIISLVMLFAAMTVSYLRKEEPNELELKEWPSNTELQLDSGVVRWVPTGRE